MSWDRICAARELLDREGLVVKGRQGQRPHPAVAIERDAKTTFAKLLRDLDLDAEDPALVGLPIRRPKLGS